jgi:thiamine kinase-like enzyme
MSSVVELIVDLHTRFAGHALLPQFREHGGELGMGFFTTHVARSIEGLKSIRSLGPSLSHEEAELRDRLLGRIERLDAERDTRASLLAKWGGPDTLLHGDLWLSNPLVAPQADRFKATLIDWDHVGMGPVTYDISTFLYRLPPKHRPWILAVYREGEWWGFPMMEEIERWFADLEPVLAGNRGR